MLMLLSQLVPTSSYVTLMSSNSLPVLGSEVTLTCVVELSSIFSDSEISLLIVHAQLSKDGTSPVALNNPIVTGKTFTFSTQINSVQKNDIGNYTCMATVRPRQSLTYLVGTDILFDTLTITASKYTQPLILLSCGCHELLKVSG